MTREKKQTVHRKSEIIEKFHLDRILQTERYEFYPVCSDNKRNQGCSAESNDHFNHIGLVNSRTLHYSLIKHFMSCEDGFKWPSSPRVSCRSVG